MKNLLLLMMLFITTSSLFSQTTYTNYNANYSTFTNQNVELQGKGMLTITGTGNPLSGSNVNLTSEDAWIYFPNLRPSEVIANVLPNIKVYGAAATNGANIRVAIYLQGAMVMPHASNYQALTIYADDYLNGTSSSLSTSAHYLSANLGSMDNNIQSFRLKKGYMATFAENDNGTGASRVYIASEGDVVVNAMPSELSNNVSMIAVRPWNWVAKKSWRGGTEGTSGADRFGTTSRYDYNNDGWSTENVEYVPMRHNKWWNGYENFYNKYSSTHALHFNEPDNGVDDGYSDVSTAIYQWPEMMASGLRVGSPAVTDGGLGWLYDFMNQCEALDYRVDFIAWHFYRAFQSAEQMYNSLLEIHQATGRPIWITEFNNGCNWTYENWVPSIEENGARIQEWIDMLENAPFVERYMVWDGCNETLRMTNSANGDLYPAGANYLNKVSTMAYTDDYYTNDMGSSVVAGTVQLKNRGTGMILDSWGGAAGVDPVKQQLGSSDHINTQWELVPVNDAYGSIFFQIKNAGTGLVIDGWGHNVDGSDVFMQDGTSTHPNTHWRFESFNGNYYRIKNRGTGMYLDGGGATAIESTCKQYANTVHVNAQWELVSTAAGTSVPTTLEGTYKIENVATGMVLDGYGSTDNGSLVYQYANWTSSNNAKWDLIYDGANYKIQNAATTMVIDGYGLFDDGASVYQYANWTSSNNAKWQFIPVDATNGIYFIQNVGSGMKLDGFGRTALGDEAAQFANWTTSTNAQWKLVPALKSATLDKDESDDLSAFKLYPNPAYTEINIELPDGFETSNVTILNSSGQAVLSIPNCTGTIDVSSLQADIYIIKILTEKNTIVSKFVKK